MNDIQIHAIGLYAAARRAHAQPPRRAVPRGCGRPSANGNANKGSAPADRATQEGPRRLHHGRLTAGGFEPPRFAPRSGGTGPSPETGHTQAPRGRRVRGPQ